MKDHGKRRRAEQRAAHCGALWRTRAQTQAPCSAQASRARRYETNRVTAPLLFTGFMLFSLYTLLNMFLVRANPAWARYVPSPHSLAGRPRADLLRPS